MPCRLRPLHHRHPHEWLHLITVRHLRRQPLFPIEMADRRLPPRPPMEIRGFHCLDLPDRLMLKRSVRLAHPRIETQDHLRRMRLTVMTAHLHKGTLLTEMLDRHKRKHPTVKRKRELRTMMRDRRRVRKLLISRR